MKIAMFTDYFFPELGGIQDSIATISRALGQRGHHVEIHAPRYGARDYAQVAAPMRERDLGTNVHVRRRASIPFPSSTRQSRVALLSPVTPAIMASRNRPDVIHAHSFFGMGLEALLSGAMLGIPVIGTNHTTIGGFGPHMPVSVGRAGAYVSWFHNRCDYVTAPSQSVFADPGLARLKRPHRVISNPIDTALFRPLEKRPPLAKRPPSITYAGRLGPEKNIEVLLHALALLRDRDIAAELRIAGHGSHEPILRRLTVALRIDQRVKFLGTLPQDDLAQLLRMSDTFAIMSTSETQSMVMLQAMSSAIPVVAANSRALPEFVTPANGVLVDPHDPVRLAQVLADLLASPARRHEMGAAGRLTAKRHGVETVTDEWEALYRSVLQGSSAE